MPTMIGSDGEKDDWDYDDDDRLERYMDAAQEEYEERLIEQGLKEAMQELYRQRGAKTGAVNKAQREERAKARQAEADKIWAKDPKQSKKAVTRELLKVFQDESADTISRMIKKPPAA